MTSVTRAPAASDEAPPLVVADRVAKRFPVREGLGRKAHVHAVEDMSFTVHEGEVLGLVGESGCGKSTLAKLLLGLLAPDSGSIAIAGHDLASLRGEALRRFRPTVQLVFQSPYQALDPRMRIGTSLEAPLAQHGVGTREERRERVALMLDRVGLDQTFLERLPGQCSGGELQRIVIARALLLEPRFLVCDEPTSALDAPLRAQIINLLVDLKRRFDLTVLVISHDLRVVRYLCDRVAVMYLGRLVEIGTREQVFDEPLHPYTRALIAASMLEENGLAAGGDVRGEPPSPLRPPGGCSFHPRCAIARARCGRDTPVTVPTHAGHHAACFYPGLAPVDPSASSTSPSTRAKLQA